MKACWLAACAAMVICLFTGGCERSSTGSSGGDVAALRGEVDQLKAEVARLKARVTGVEARATRAATSVEKGGKPNFTATGRAPAVSKERAEEMRRRHEERMRRMKEERQKRAGAAQPAAPAASGEAKAEGAAAK